MSASSRSGRGFRAAASVSEQPAKTTLFRPARVGGGNEGDVCCNCREQLRPNGLLHAHVPDQPAIYVHARIQHEPVLRLLELM